MSILKKTDYPRVLKAYPQIKGVSFGKCISDKTNRWYEPYQVLAHTHVGEDDPHHGWMCFRDRYLLRDKQLVIHELAHLLTGHGHDNTWRDKVLELGGHLDSYLIDSRREYTRVPCFHEKCMRGSK